MNADALKKDKYRLKYPHSSRSHARAWERGNYLFDEIF